VSGAAVEPLKVTRMRAGKYVVTRARDGALFTVLRATLNSEWIIENDETCALCGAPTLRGALYDIRDGWTKGVTR
jgi:hypothetical protein